MVRFHVRHNNQFLNMKQIEVNSDAWVSLIEEIVISYSDGKLISHEWLKEKFGLKQLLIEDF